jgi:hypothetical protein
MIDQVSRKRMKICRLKGDMMSRTGVRLWMMAGVIILISSMFSGCDLFGGRDDTFYFWSQFEGEETTADTSLSARESLTIVMTRGKAEGQGYETQAAAETVAETTTFYISFKDQEEEGDGIVVTGGAEDEIDMGPDGWHVAQDFTLTGLQSGHTYEVIGSTDLSETSGDTTGAFTLTLTIE